MSLFDATVTEKQTAQRERAAFYAGALYAHSLWVATVATPSGKPVLLSEGAVHKHASELYPLPKIRRPRVVRAGNSLFRVVDGALEMQTAVGACCPHDVGWSRIDAVAVKHVPVVADLLANPTEFVEDEGEVTP
jgi:hypothetical protein